MTFTPTLRRLLTTRLALVAGMGEQLGLKNEQLAELRSGADVVFPRAQLETLVPPSTAPALASSESWTLSGDSTLTPT